MLFPSPADARFSSPSSVLFLSHKSRLVRRAVVGLLDCHRLGQVAREVDVEALHHGEPVGDELQRDDVEDALQDVDRLGDLYALRLGRLEFLVALVADDDRPASSGGD